MSELVAVEPLAPTDDGEPPVWPITVELYSRMVEVGVLNSTHPAYLWQGRLAPVLPKRRPHSAALRMAFDVFFSLLPAEVHAEREQPLAFRYAPSVPEPDIMVLRGGVDAYPRDFPTTGDTLLLVEIADQSLARDRKRAAAYASEDVPFYWLIDLAGSRVEVYSQPIDGAYASKATLSPGDTIPLVLDGREVARIAVADLLP